MPAANGLRRGRTTGSCATAAVKAALRALLGGASREHEEVTLPDAQQYLVVPILEAGRRDSRTAWASVLKDGGDDPDSTHGATITARVSRNDCGTIRFFAGPGVGTVTRPGLRVPVGEPAINPVPRRMMERAVRELLDEFHADARLGFDLTIGCDGGEAIAKHTFNPRLGIVGGISILGTTGIVEPMSVASWVASIEVYVRVALADHARCVAYLPGKIGRDYARDALRLPPARTVQIANFLGESLDFTQQALAQARCRLETLWLLGHPGKLAKVLDGHWDTHSSRSEMAMGGIARVAAQHGFAPQTVATIAQANTVEESMEQLRGCAGARDLWIDVERRIAAAVHARASLIDRVEVRLFDLQGRALGADA